MKKSFLIIIGLIIVAAVIMFLAKGRKTESGETTYQYTKLQRGDIENLVSCTGTLNPKSVVEVGTQISGTVEEVLADFNDEVEKNQIIAILDQRQLKINFDQAEVNLEKSQANYDYLKTIYENKLELQNEEMIADLDVAKAKNDMISAKASLLNAEYALENSRLDLEEYSIIRSPINGLILSRDVEPGQTVAASLSSPVLFEIAEDLSIMEIYALVDESDIGYIIEGQIAVCTVDAYPEEEFEGVVKEVRLQPETISNVVTYTVIVEAENRENILLPGMTANIDFVVEHCENVLTIENTALSFTPTEEIMQSMREEMMKKRQKMEQNGEGERPQRSGGMGGMQGMSRNGSSTMPSDMARLWYKTDDGSFRVAMVRTGATDGVKTEITDLGRLDENANIILKSHSNSSSTNKRSGRPGQRLF